MENGHTASQPIAANEAQAERIAEEKNNLPPEPSITLVSHYENRTLTQSSNSNYGSRYRDPNRDRDRNRRESKEFDPDSDSDFDFDCTDVP
jgi:hypothetical protein